MTKFRSILAASVLALGFAGSAHAQMFYMTTSHEMRASKLIGTPIYNDHNEKIGMIDDVVVPEKGGEAMAVLSVGGFVGGNKMVRVPLSHVQGKGDKVMMPGADGEKTALMKMPPYSYGLNGGGG